ncbi:MAG: hypothetical protein M3R47_11210 [Chloroflexota bacterium]|nr:hypothetical protein [Chloroflexota bacterium]
MSTPNSSTAVNEIFQRIVANNFSDFAGLAVDASIPVPEQMINEIIEAALQGNQNIEYCRISIGEQNRISVNVKTPRWPWPINLKVWVFKSVDLAPSPKIRVLLENNVILGKLGVFFKALPEGVKLYGGQIVIDVGYFLQTEQQRKLLAMLKSMEIRTEMGKLILDVQIRIDG